MVVTEGLFNEQDQPSLFLAVNGARVLALIVSVLALFMVITTALLWQAGSPMLRGASVPALLLALLVLLLLWRRREQLALRLFIWGAVLLAAYAGLTVSGLQTPGLMFLPVLTMAGCWLLGTRQGTLLTLVVLLLILLIGLLQAHQLLPAPVQRPLSVMLLAHLCIALISGILGIASIACFRHQYRQTLALSRATTETLEARVAERTAELAAAVELLRKARDERLQSEKLVALGSLVAGISHELNTPIGNSLLVASTLHGRLQEMRDQFAAGQLTRSAMAAFVDEGLRLAEAAERANRRAAELIASFKQVAVDQESERRREFRLAQVVADNLATLHPALKRDGVAVMVDIPSMLRCDSHPGPFGQILVNLVQNALIHAFAHGGGEIAIAGRLEDGWVSLTVSDNGRGMDERTLARIFEPFFTTRLGKGGSGLGLSICHRLATAVLGGALSVHSAPGQGATFTLRFPAVAPRQDEAPAA